MSSTLNPAQRRRVDQARALSDIPDGDREALAAYIKTRADSPVLYAEAFGWARATIDDLLEVVDSLTGGAS
jgi:hypothetical protein